LITFPPIFLFATKFSPLGPNIAMFVVLLGFLVLGASAGGIQQESFAGGRGSEQALENTWSRELDPETKAVDYKSPIKRVVDLLLQMRKQLQQEAANEVEMYDQQVCWCETNDKEKTKAIADADVKTNDLQADIESRAAALGELNTNIAALKEQIAEDESALKQATSIREKESAAFSDTENDMVQALTNLKNAILVLSRHHKTHGADASLLQLDAPLLASVRAVLHDVGLKYELLAGDSMDKASNSFGSLRSATALLSIGREQRSSLNRDLLGVLGEHGSADILPLNIAEHMLAQSSKQALKSGSFVQAQGHSLQPGIYQSYSPRSSTIYGILQQMKDEFEANLSQEQKDEMKARADFEALSASKTEQISTAKAKLDSLEDARAENQKHLSDAKEDFEATRAQRSADVEFLRNLKVTCQALDKEWAERSATRAEQIKAISEALAVIQEDDSADLLRKTVVLVQVVSNTDTAMRRARAAESLRHAARSPGFQTDDLLAAWQSHTGASTGAANAKLATLAVSVELDSFTEVKAAMDKMIADLKDQQTEEVKSKAYCVKELDQNEKSIYTKEQEKADLETKLDMLETAIQSMKEEIDKAKAQITETDKQIKKAGENREKENAEFQSVVADQRATQTILHKALVRLQLFYKKNMKATGGSATLLQGTSKNAQTPPVKFNKYTKHAGGATVMGLIEQIIEDSKKVEADALNGEQQAQAEYESFVKSSNGVISKLSDAITIKTKAISDAKVEFEEAKSAHVSAVGELESLTSYEADLHAQCDFLLKNFDTRQKARLQEIEAIQQAKAILSGEK